MSYTERRQRMLNRRKFLRYVGLAAASAVVGGAGGASDHAFDGTIPARTTW